MPSPIGQRSAHLIRVALALTLVTVLLVLMLTPSSAAAAARCREGFELLPGAAECTPIAPQEPPVREEPTREPPLEPVVEIPPVEADPEGEDPVVISDPEDSVGISDPEDSVAIPAGGSDPTLTEPPASFAIDPILPQDPSDQLGSVSLYKRGCPAGFDAYAATVMTLVTTCDDPMEGTTFTLYHGGGSSATLPTAGDVVGASYVEWQDVFPGPFTLAEDLPPGFGTPIVTCSSSVGGVEGPELLPAVTDGAIVADLPPAGQFHCYWFNVPVPESSASVVKWLCPSEIDTTSIDQNDYFAACTTPMDEVVFHLTGKGQEPALTEGEATVDGVVEFGGITLEMVVITEVVPAGFAASVVFCATYAAPPLDPPTDLVLQTVVDGQITYDLPPGHHVRCYWFNVPEGDASTGFTLEKWRCPAEIDTTSEDLELYETACAEPQDGIDFSLTADDYGIAGTTVDGVISWPPLVPGSYTVAEEIPAGYGEPVVFCGVMVPTADPSDQAATIEHSRRDVFDGNAITIQAHGEPMISCYWFNVPLPGDGGDPDGGDEPDDPDGGDEPDGGGDPDRGTEPEPGDVPVDEATPQAHSTPTVFALPDTGTGSVAPASVRRTPWLAFAFLIAATTATSRLLPGRLRPYPF